MCILKQNKTVNVLKRCFEHPAKTHTDAEENCSYGKEHNHTVLKSPLCIILFLLGNRSQYSLRHNTASLKTTITTSTVFSASLAGKCAS